MVGLCSRSQGLTRRRNSASVSRPAPPSRLEWLLNRHRQLPKGCASLSAEELSAPTTRHREDHTSLCEPMGPRKPTPPRDGAITSQQTLCVPPACAVHLTVASNHQSEPEKAVHIDHGLHRRQRLRSDSCGRDERERRAGIPSAETLPEPLPSVTDTAGELLAPAGPAGCHRPSRNHQALSTSHDGQDTPSRPPQQTGR